MLSKMCIRDRIQSVAQSSSAPIAAGASQWVGRPWVDTVTGDTRRKVELMLTDLKTTGIARRREVNVPGVQTGDVPVAFSALRLGASGPVLAVGRDLRAVSAIQQRFLDAQQELERGYWRARQAESRYRLLFQVATDAVLTVDASSLRVIEANHAAASLLGAGMSLVGRAAPDLFDRSSRALLQELLLGAGSTGRPAEIHVRLPRAQSTAAPKPHGPRASATVSAVSYTHLDVYKRQPVHLRANTSVRPSPPTRSPRCPEKGNSPPRTTDC